MQPHIVEFRDEHVDVPFPIAPIIGTIPSYLVHNDVVDPIVDTNVDHIVQGNVPNPDVIEPTPRRSRRVSTSKSTRFKDYIVYLSECEFNFVGDISISFHEATSNSDHLQWMVVMEDELASMKKNGVWDLVELLIGCKFIGCKWIFNTKHDANGEVGMYKTRLVGQGYNEKGRHRL